MRSRSATATAWRRSACRSRSWCRPCRSGSAPSTAAFAALIYLAAYGTRAPLLAFLGLRRLPNLVLVVAPYAATVPLFFFVSDRLEPSTAAGLVALATAPGALFAPTVVSAAGGRRSDMAGALLLGTVVLSVLLVATRPATGSVGLAGAQAFLIGSFVAGAMPTVRDRIATPLRWASRLAALVVITLAVASGAAIDVSAFLVSLAAVALTLGIAGVVALVLRRDVLSAAAAAGTRDPVLAIALAWSTGGSSATAVPIVSAVILGIVAAALVMLRR